MCFSYSFPVGMIVLFYFSSSPYYYYYSLIYLYYFYIWYKGEKQALGDAINLNY